jgi:uncharacterized protein
MSHPVVFYEVAGNDRDALVRFYTEAFGWTVNDVPGPMPYSTVEPGGEGGIAGGIGATPPGMEGGHVTWYVDTDDIEATLGRIEGLGGGRVMGPMDVPGGRIAQFRDPEGNVIGLWSGTAGAGPG